MFQSKNEPNYTITSHTTIVSRVSHRIISHHITSHHIATHHDKLKLTASSSMLSAVVILPVRSWCCVVCGDVDCGGCCDVVWSIDCECDRWLWQTVAAIAIVDHVPDNLCL